MVKRIVSGLFLLVRRSVPVRQDNCVVLAVLEVGFSRIIGKKTKVMVVWLPILFCERSTKCAAGGPANAGHPIYP